MKIMKLRVIESIIDSIDIFNVVKDMGLKVISKEGNPNIKAINTTYDSILIQNNELKLINSAFLNLDLYKGSFNSFVSGSGIDLLAFYFNGDYDKAFNAYFRIYGVSLRSKLVHEPAFIKGVLKNTYIKRHNLINLTVSYLFGNTFSNNIECKTWLSKKNIEEESSRGIMFALSSDELRQYLVFLLNQEFTRFEQVTLDIAKEYSLSKIVPEIEFDNTYFKNYIITPYFSNYYSLSFLKITNPLTNEVSYVYLDDMHIAYAGLYAVNKFFNLNSKIRLIEDPIKAAALISNAKKLLNAEKQYLAIGVNENGINTPTLNFSKPIFLYEPNSSFNLLKILNITLPNLYICDFKNFTESSVVYRWEDFIFRELKKIVEEDAYLSPRIKSFLDLIDFSSFKIKRYIANWLKENKYDDIYSAFNTLSNQVVHFKNYSISSTNNGYVALIKSTNDTVLISNFIIKLNNCIIFKNKDDMKVNGVVIMGDNEYPLTFYKKELSKKDAISNIALKAFANFNILDGVFNESTSTEIRNVLPTIIDNSYNSVLSTMLNNELSKIPCTFGLDNKGWDKTNKLFSTPVWRASAINNLKILPQYFYETTAADYCYNNNLIKITDYKRGGYAFLNKEIKDTLSILLAYLYRTYFSYNIKPSYFNDTKTARNLLRFIFAALGQRDIFEYDVNDRLIRNKKVLQNFNNFPILLRTNNIEQLSKINNYPFIALTTKNEFIEDLYDIHLNLKRDDYPKVTKFALDTFERFFNWIFSVKVEEFEIEEIEVKDQEQLIKEGNEIFDLIWWEEVINACKKDVEVLGLFKQFIRTLKAETVELRFKFVPDANCYIFSKHTIINLPKEKRMLLNAALKADREKIYIKYSKQEKDLHDNYLKVDKEFFDKAIAGEILKDGREIDVKKIDMFFFDNVESEKFKQRSKSIGDLKFSYTKFSPEDLLKKTD